MTDFDFHKIKKSSKKKKASRLEQPNDFFKAIHHFIEVFVSQRLDLEKQKQEKSFIDLFLSKIKKIFTFIGRKIPENLEKSQGVKREELNLTGRIRELDKNAEDVLSVLNNCREDLKQEVDQELYPFVESVMNPMIRDILRIQKIVKKDGVMQQKIEAFNQYNRWLDRAKLFVQVCSTSKNKEVISEAIVKHTLEDFKELIDRDLQLIRDYEDHLLGDLKDDHGKKTELQKKIKKSLKPYLKSLINLKNQPENLNLDNLNEWKDEADRSRSFYFDAILQVIDKKTKKFNPKEEKLKESDLLAENLAQVSCLEKEIPYLIAKLKESQELEDENFLDLEKQVTLTQIISLGEEVEDLYHDMKMPQELIKRLYVLKKMVDKIKENLII